MRNTTGLLPHDISPSTAWHPPHALTTSISGSHLKASQTFHPAKHLQLPRARRSSQWRVIASRGPDVDRRHAPSPAELLFFCFPLQTGTLALQKSTRSLTAGSRIPLLVNNTHRNPSCTWDGASITLPGCRVGVQEPYLFLMAKSTSSAQCMEACYEEAIGKCGFQKQEPD